MTSVLLATDADWIFDEVDASLSDEETTVYRVRTGREAIAASAELRPDLVVLDLQIGNSGGVATSLYLRQEQEVGRLDDFRVIMLLDRIADVFVAQFAKADGWLIKPLDAIRLRRAARAVLAGGEVREGLAPTSA